MKNLLAAAAALLVFAPGVALAQDDVAASEKSPFTGVRGEARIGWETPTISGSGNVYKIESNVSYGGEIGFDAAVSNKVTLGAYGSYEVSNVDLCSGTSCLGEEGMLNVGGRIGFIASPKALVYLKAGYGQFTLKAKSGAAVGTDNIGGVQGALGVEISVAKHVYVNLEAGYGDYGELYNTGYNLQRRHVAAGVGFRF